MGAAVGGGAGLRPRLDYDCRHARHHNCFSSYFVPVWYRSGEGLCGDAQFRSVCEFVHSGVRVARNLRLAAEPQTARRGIKHRIVGYAGIGIEKEF